MWRIGCFALCFALPCLASESEAEILEHIRATVTAQLSRVVNYTCVETIDRTYLRSGDGAMAGCRAPLPRASFREVGHDRLRLDVAVSEGSEIYAWHGQDGFSSAEIMQLVPSGPVSSGGFIGFLRNVFYAPGVEYKYTGKSDVNGVGTYTFSYSVPLSSSRYHLQSRHGMPIVPFHGSFSAEADDFQLLTLEAVADAIPPDSNICSAETRVQYQSANISGRESLLPGTFTLRIGDDHQLRTVSQGAYSQCREFRGESTLRFNDAAPDSETPAVQPSARQELPAGVNLHVALTTTITDQTSFTGDAVHGVLLDAVTVSGGQTVPENTAVEGVITKLERHNEPYEHYFVRIEWERMNASGQVYRFRSRQLPTGKEAGKLFFIFGDPLPGYVRDELNSGTMILPGRHIHVDRHFSATWQTISPQRQSITASHE